MSGPDIVLQPVDPTATGETEVTRVVREALKRKRDDDGADAGAAGGAQSAAAAAAAAAATLPPQAKTCVHEVALPAGFSGDREALLAPRYTGARAKEYPFTLDPFQETAIACLVRVRRCAKACRLRAAMRSDVDDSLTLPFATACGCRSVASLSSWRRTPPRARPWLQSARARRRAAMQRRAGGARAAVTSRRVRGRVGCGDSCSAGC
jgi:hypothetical protein